MINSRGLILLIFMFANKAVCALPSIDEVANNLSIGGKVKWELDIDRTSCSLGGNDTDSNHNVCNKNLKESLVFISSEKVDIITSNINGEHKTKTTKAWMLKFDNENNNNTIHIDNDIYIILFSNDGNLMKLLSNPGSRNNYSEDKIYKRN